MAADKRQSKLSRALARDLAGEGLVRRNFREGELSVERDLKEQPEKSFFTRNRWLLVVGAVFFLAVSLVRQGTFPVHFSSLVSGLRQSGSEPGQHQAVTASPLKAEHSVRTASTSHSEDTGEKGMPKGECMMRKSAYGNSAFSFDQELRFARACLGVTAGMIYCWNDAEGITHFSTSGFPDQENISMNWVKY
jgi:hypothetical protein